MDFFSKCNTQEEAKSTFKRLCKCFHPDKGGEEALMIDLKNQYDNWTPSYEAHKFNFTLKGTGWNCGGLDGIYETKINELNGLIFHLRNENEALRSINNLNQNKSRDLLQEILGLKSDLMEAKVNLAEKQREIIEKKDDFNNMSLSGKLKKVFGYE